MTVLNIHKGCFGDCIRNGDLIAVGNVIEHLRKINKQPHIKFHMMPGAISTEEYCTKFFEFLKKQTDWFSEHQSQDSLQWERVNLWDFRDISGDLVKITNNETMKKKIVIFPLFDAPYNTYRNWPPKLLETICKKYSTKEYDDYEKLICVGKYPFGHKELISVQFKYSFDFMENINHIQTAEIFIGGDTGTTHFAFSLDRAPKDLIYYNSSRGLIHTLPFYLMEGKGRMSNYWLDFEGTKF
jgi:ADP-heptose:LPS heptosyltransferase